MKLKLFITKTGRLVGRIFISSFWRRSGSSRSCGRGERKVGQDGVLTGEVLREMLKHGDEEKQENERKTDQI